jgi:thioredoxin reductase
LSRGLVPMADTVRKKQKLVVVGAGPVGSLAALYAAARGDEVEIYELRGGRSYLFIEIGNDCTMAAQFLIRLCVQCAMYYDTN